jgi:hypothetical protein
VRVRWLIVVLTAQRVNTVVHSAASIPAPALADGPSIQKACFDLIWTFGGRPPLAPVCGGYSFGVFPNLFRREVLSVASAVLPMLRAKTKALRLSLRGRELAAGLLHPLRLYPFCKPRGCLARPKGAVIHKKIGIDEPSSRVFASPELVAVRPTLSHLLASSPRYCASRWPAGQQAATTPVARSRLWRLLPSLILTG